MNKWFIKYDDSSSYPYNEVIEANDIYELIHEDSFRGDIEDIVSITKLDDED